MDGSVKVWGISSYGASDPSISSGVVNIYSTSRAFAALKSDGSVQVWGYSSWGGSDPSISSGVVNIYSTYRAFAALKSDGSVQVWGDSSYGGSDPSISSGVVNIYSNKYVFVAVGGTSMVYGPELLPGDENVISFKKRLTDGSGTQITSDEDYYTCSGKKYYIN